MFSQVFIRSTACRLNSTVCRRHFAILAIVPPIRCKVRLFTVSQFWGSVHKNRTCFIRVHPCSFVAEMIFPALHSARWQHEAVNGDARATMLAAPRAAENDLELGAPSRSPAWGAPL